MLPCEFHLKSDFNSCNTTCPRPECRTDQSFDFSFRCPVVLTYRNEGRPCCEIYVIRSGNVHRHSHRRNMHDVGMIGSTGFDNESCANRLLAKKLLDDPFLDLVLQFASEKLQDRQVHPCIHQTKRVSGCGNAVKRWNGFERSEEYFHLRRIPCSPADFIRRVFAAGSNNEAHLSFLLHLRPDFQSQRVQPDEALGVVLITGLGQYGSHHREMRECYGLCSSHALSCAISSGFRRRLGGM